MKLLVKKINPDAKILQVALAGDAAMDLYSIEDLILAPGERASVKTGIAIKIPEGYAGLIWDKSGVSHKFGIKTLGGVIDSGYTGEWKIGLINLSKENFEIKKGQKIAQVLFQKVENPEIELVEEMPETERGKRGFGSTNKE